MIQLNVNSTEMQKLYDEIDEELRWEESANDGMRNRIAHHNRLYLGEPKQRVKNFPWPKASNIVVPLVGTFVDAVYARHMNTVFGQPTVWQVLALSKAWTQAAPRWRKFLEYESYYTMGLFNSSSRWIFGATKHGLGVLRVTWEKVLKKRIVKDPRSGAENEIPYYFKDAPGLLPVPLDHCHWPDDAVDVESARWFGRDYWVPLRRYDLGVRRGFYTDPDESVRNTRRMIEFTPSEEQAADKSDRSSPRPPDGIRLYEISWTIDLDNDGIEEELIMVINRDARRIVRLIWHPYFHQRRYFVGIQYWPHDNRVEGLGMCSMLEQLTEAITTVHNQASDNATAANTRIWGVKPGNPQIRPGMRTYPGMVVTLTDPVNDLVPKQLGEVYPSIVEREAILRDYAERRVGVTDYSLGRESPVVGWRATATSTVSLLQEAARRFDLTLRNIREGFREVALQSTELYQQFPPVDRITSIFEEESDSVLRFMQNPPSPVRDGINILTFASTAARNIEQERESFVQLFQLLSGYYQTFIQATTLITNPQIPALTKAATAASLERGAELMRRILENWPIPDPESFLIDERDLGGLVRELQPVGQGGGYPALGAPPTGGGGGIITPGGGGAAQANA